MMILSLDQQMKLWRQVLKVRPSEELEPQFDVQENLDQETISN